MLRLIFRFFGFLFSWAAMAAVLGLAGLAAIFTIYGRDLPDYAQLERYEPATLSRIYSGQGKLMDEFARERRIFTPIDEIPERIRRAFISAEDKNFYDHHGLKMMSIGLLVNEREALVWRGPMIHSFIQQMLKDVLWGPLDYLLTDSVLHVIERRGLYAMVSA